MGDRVTNPLIVWTLATFHTALLVAVLVFLLHVTGPLGDLLGGLDTLVGLALFVVLWATTWWTNRRWLEGVQFRSEERPPTSDLLRGGVGWGGANGVLFFWGVYLLAVVPTFGFQVVPLSIIAAAGTVFALAVGGFVGLAFAALDAVLLSFASRLATEGASASGRL